MKRTKKTIVMVGVILTAILALLCLTSCGDIISQVKQKTSSDAKTTNASKVEFAEAAGNFDSKNVKKSDITVKLKGTVFTQQDFQASGYKDSYTIGSTLTIERIQNLDKVYLGIKANVSDTDTEVSGLIDGLMTAQFLNNSDIETSLRRLGEDGEETKEKMNKYLTALHHYVTGQVDMGAELGLKGNTYNLKAHYDDHEEEPSNNIWFVADSTSVFSWLQNNTQIDLTDNEINSFLMKTAFSTLKKSSSIFDKDNANKYVDKNGKSEYDILIKPEELSKNILVGILDLCGVKDVESIAGKYAQRFQDIQSWISLKTDNVCGDAKDNLINKVTAGGKLDLNIDSAGLVALLTQLQSDGLIEKKACTIATFIVNMAQLYLCGTDGSDSKIGLQFSVSVKESFSYSEKECVLTDEEHSDYFIGIDTDVDGRVNLNDYVNGLINDIDVYIADFLKNLGEEYADEIEEIRTKIMERVDEMKDENGKIAIEKVISVIREVMKEYTPKDGDSDSTSGGIDMDKVNNILDSIKGFVGKK